MTFSSLIKSTERRKRTQETCRVTLESSGLGLAMQLIPERLTEKKPKSLDVASLLCWAAHPLETSLTQIPLAFMIYALIKDIEHRMGFNALFSRINHNTDRFYL